LREVWQSLAELQCFRIWHHDWTLLLRWRESVVVARSFVLVEPFVGDVARMSEVRVKVSRCYRGVDYSIEANPTDFSVIGKVLRAIEEFIDVQIGETCE